MTNAPMQGHVYIPIPWLTMPLDGLKNRIQRYKEGIEDRRFTDEQRETFAAYVTWLTGRVQAAKTEALLRGEEVPDDE